MKRFYFILFALLAYVGMANATEKPVSGAIQAGVEYAISETGNSVDDFFTTSEVIGAGQTVVVFYYNHSTDGIWGQSPIYFGPNGDQPLLRNKTLKDAAGNSVCKLVADTDNAFDAEGHAVIEVYQPKEEGATWTYVICTEAEASTLAVPEFGATGPVVLTKGADVKPNTLYALPFSGSNYIDDNTVTLETAATADQYIVVFLNAPGVTNKAIDFKNIFYNGAGNRNYTAGSDIEDGGDFSFKRYYRQGADSKLEIYASDMAGYDDGYTWSYVIVNSLDEAKTVENPFAKKGEGDGPTVLPGQDVANAILLTAGESKEFTSVNVGGRHTLYVKIVAANSGIVTMNLGATPNNKKWMEEGVMAYGALKQNILGESFNVEKGKTYYCLYNFAEETTSTISYTLQAAEQGGARGEAILIEANGQYNLLGVPSVEVEGGKNYTNKTTWFKIAKDGALKTNNLVSVTIGGDNTTEVALYVNDEAMPSKTYAMGDGSGMLAKNSTVKFDIDLSENDYYVGITQDDVNGTANFTFKVADEGETRAHAFPAVAGSNTVEKAGWYKYTHAGDMKVIKISGISKIVNENGGLVAEGDDVKVGFVITNGTSIYFEASGNFTITLSDVEKGMTADDPVIIDNVNGATFNLSGAATDTQRFMQYTATEDGTFIYATQNASVLEYAVSATVRDVTNAETPKPVTIVQEQSAEFGETYFIYKWPVVAGHTYLIEQSLGNNFGTVEFFTMFTPAEAGETINKAISMDLYEAKDLGRQATTPKYYKFTAAEAGDYTLSVQMKGYVKSYDAEGNGSSIGQNYSNGLVYHNETFTLAAGETLVFSCEPSETIEHIAGGVQDQLIPNYYATITKADETGGLDYNQPESISENDEMTLGDNNVWMGPIEVAAGETLYVQANLVDESEDAAIFFAVETNSGLQWINKDSEISLSVDGKTQLFTVAPAKEDRNIQILAYGMKHNGTFKYAFNSKDLEPVEPVTLTIAPEVAYNAEENKLTVSFVVPATYDDSETAVEGLNIALDKIVNVTTGEEEKVDNGGAGVYAAGETFTAQNTIAMAINEGDVLRFEFWKADNLKHVTLKVANFSYTPIEDEAYYIVITNGETQQKIKVSADVKLEWKKGSELKK